MLPSEEENLKNWNLSLLVLSLRDCSYQSVRLCASANLKAILQVILPWLAEVRVTA